MDALAVRRWSETEFGLAVAQRYLSLIAQAYADLAEKPDRPGVARLPGLSAGFWLYPIRHSLIRIQQDTRLRTARHVVAFRYNDDKVEIARLLHDSMDIPSRLA